MAALVTGLIPILRTAVDATTTYKCRSLWFGFLCIRLVVLFLAELPFTKLDADFKCNETKETICTQACYNRRFNKPMMVAWNSTYVLVIISVLLMELFTSHLRSVAQKGKVKAEAEMEVQGVSTEPKGKTVLDLHRDRRSVGFYLFSIVLRILIETWFMYVLLSWNLPALNDDLYECSKTDKCLQLECIVRAAPEKRMAIYALASLSGTIIVVSVLFCMYSIAHYLCNC